MKLFKDIYCTHCGAKTSMLARIKLRDGSYLCGECASKIPSYMEESVRTHYSYTDFKTFLEYINISGTHLRPQFRETHSYYSIHIDTENKLFYLGQTLKEDTMILRFCDISEFNLVFDAEEFKEGLLGDKVTGKILMILKMETPYFYYEKILDSSAKAKAKKKFLSSSVSYENPNGMDEFMLYFRTAWEASFSEYDGTYESNNTHGETRSDELQAAMSLFMLDSLESVSLEDIKVLRNRLIKTFHPDKGLAEDTVYAQKINNAYVILKDHLEQ